jgi:hypothetical protein
MATGISAPAIKTTTQPPPVIILPIFCCLPLRVSGMPIDRESLDLAADTLVNRLHENPLQFILVSPSVQKKAALQSDLTSRVLLSPIT